MSELIGDVPVSSIQKVTVSRVEGENEVDLIDEESNVIIGGIDEGQEIEIEFTLVEELHPDEDPISEQQEEMRKLLEQKYPENDIQYYNLNGFISFNDISFLESSDTTNILDGKMSGIFLPYPKYEGGVPDSTVFDFAYDAAFE